MGPLALTEAPNQHGGCSREPGSRGVLCGHRWREGRGSPPACDDGVSSGGMGGVGTKGDGSDGESGDPVPVTNPMAYGLGGTGQDVLSCTDGRRGLAGDDGANGNGASGQGGSQTQG